MNKVRERVREIDAKLRYKAQGWKFNSYLLFGNNGEGEGAPGPLIVFQFSSPSRCHRFYGEDLDEFIEWLENLVGADDG